MFYDDLIAVLSPRNTYLYIKRGLFTTEWYESSTYCIKNPVFESSFIFLDKVASL